MGNTLIEACFAWSCRSRGIHVAFKPILQELAQDTRVQIIRHPSTSFVDTLRENVNNSQWVINNTRPAFDKGDFMRFGKVILGQYSHVTNEAGVDYVRQHLPEGYRIEILKVNDLAAMHIGSTILPLRKGLLVYNPHKVTKSEIRAHYILADWTLKPHPFVPQTPEYPSLYMTSPWLALNALVLDGKRVVVEASDDRTADWYEQLGMECIRCPFRHVNSIGGLFHCATVDLVRESETS